MFNFTTLRSKMSTRLDCISRSALSAHDKHTVAKSLVVSLVEYHLAAGLLRETHVRRLQALVDPLFRGKFGLPHGTAAAAMRLPGTHSGLDLPDLLGMQVAGHKDALELALNDCGRLGRLSRCFLAVQLHGYGYDVAFAAGSRFLTSCPSLWLRRLVRLHESAAAIAGLPDALPVRPFFTDTPPDDRAAAKLISLHDVICALIPTTPPRTDAPPPTLPPSSTVYGDFEARKARLTNARRARKTCAKLFRGLRPPLHDADLGTLSQPAPYLRRTGVGSGPVWASGPPSPPPLPPPTEDQRRQEQLLYADPPFMLSVEAADGFRARASGSGRRRRWRGWLRSSGQRPAAPATAAPTRSRRWRSSSPPRPRRRSWRR